jgi:DMSO/TMAO reductase YedYZ molybdopterin-dependent catalytic subunit
MKKKIALIAVALAVTIITVSAVFLTVYNPQPMATIKLPAGQPPQWQIAVSGNVEEQKTWTLEQISQMPLTEVTAAVNGENVTYNGVTLIDFCNKTGMLWDAGPIDITGTGGQRATVNVFQAWNSTAYPYYQEKNRIALVFVKNGQWMTDEDGGPVKLIAPYFSPNHQIEHVTEVNIGIWTISISGAVANPLTINKNNLSDFKEETVQAEFVPGDGKRTSNWTGLTLSNVLEKAGISDRAEKVTIVAIDGYVKNYTLTEVNEARMLIGYMENSGHFWQDQGGPYRLFCTTDKYKWAQFWV